MHSHYVKMQTCNWCYFRTFSAKSPNILSKSRIHYLLLFDQYFPSFLLKRHKHPLNVLNGTQWGLAFVQWQSRGLVKAEQTEGARFAVGSLKIYIDSSIFYHGVFNLGSSRRGWEVQVDVHWILLERVNFELESGSVQLDFTKPPDQDLLP